MADFCIISCWIALIAINWQQGLAVTPPPSSPQQHLTSAQQVLIAIRCLGCGRTVLHLHTSAQGELLQLQVQLTKLRTAEASGSPPQRALIRSHSLSYSHTLNALQQLSACFQRVISFTFVGQKLLNLQATPKRCSKHVSNESKNSLALSVCRCCARLFTCCCCCRCRCFVWLATPAATAAIAACISIKEELSR